MLASFQLARAMRGATTCDPQATVRPVMEAGYARQSDQHLARGRQCQQRHHFWLDLLAHAPHTDSDPGPSRTASGAAPAHYCFMCVATSRTLLGCTCRQAPRQLVMAATELGCGVSDVELRSYAGGRGQHGDEQPGQDAQRVPSRKNDCDARARQEGVRRPSLLRIKVSSARSLPA